MRVLMISGDYKCGNIGDVAMLQVAVERLKQLWPGVTIQVLTNNPGALSFHCPGVEPVFHRGRQIWCSDQYLLGGLHGFLPKPVSQFLINLNRRVRQRAPSFLRRMIKIKMRLRGADDRDVGSFIDAFRRAHVVVACGQAGLNDLVRSHMVAVLDLLEMAIRAGKVTAMFSQGIGPLHDVELQARARAVLPKVDLIALRENRAAWPILESSGVPAHRVLTTGDDAIEMAYGYRPTSRGLAIGINVRLAGYAGVDRNSVEKIRPILQAFARKVGAPLIPIPISRHEDLRDAMALRQLLAGYNGGSDGGRDLDTPLKVIEQAGRCRIVVTGAYHGAVFALSQGIPAVCLAASEYVTNKFKGLIAQFGAGCYVVDLNSSDLTNELSDAIDSAWQADERVRTGLLEAARRQIDIGRSAYRSVKELTESKRSAA